MKYTNCTLVGLVIAYVTIFLVQLWGMLFSDEIFCKITLSFSVVFGAILIIALIRKYLTVEETLKKDKFVD